MTVTVMMGVVVHVIGVVNVNAATPIPPVVPVVVPVIRVPEIAVVPDVQMVAIPADCEGRRHSPEIVVMKRMAGGIGIVVNRIGARIVVINTSRLIDDDFFRFVVGHVDDVVLNRCDADDAILFGHLLEVVRFEVAGCVGPVAKRLYRRNNVRLLSNDCLAEPPGPIQILTHHLQDFRVIGQRNDCIIPIVVRL